MQKKSLTIYFDFLSPFSYFLFHKIDNNRELLSNIEIFWKPVVLAKLLTHWEIKAPAEVAPKREYLFKQSLRYASKNNIIFNPPATHPFNPLYVLRLACLATHNGEMHQQEKLIKWLWQIIWEQGKTPDNPEELTLWLSAENFHGEKLINQTYQKDVKDQLKDNTQEAIEKRIFGVPSMLAKNTHSEDVFWGNDAFEDVISFLNDQDLLDKKKYQDIVASTLLGPSARLKL